MILYNDEVFLQPRFTDDKAKERRASNSVSLHPFLLHLLNIISGNLVKPVEELPGDVEHHVACGQVQDQPGHTEVTDTF